MSEHIPIGTLNIHCPDCGSEQFKRPSDFDFKNNFNDVSCANCGRVIIKDDVITQAKNTALDHTKKIIADVFSKGGWK